MAHRLLVVLCVVAPVIVAGKIGLYFLRRKFSRMTVVRARQRLVRAQHGGFVVRLRDLVFSDPFRFMNMLCSRESDWFVRGLWKEEGDKWARVRLPGGAEGEAMSDAEEGEPHPVRLSDEGLGVEKIRLNDGHVLAVVRMPQPKVMGETYLIGVVLPPDETLKKDVGRARKLVKFFVVNRWEGERGTDFCQWTVGGKVLTYNVGAPLDANGFALAIQGKLEDEARRRRARRSTA